MSDEKQAEQTALVTDYALTTKERTVLKTYLEKREVTAPRPLVKVVASAGKVTSLAPDHPCMHTAHVLLANALGTSDQSFINTLLVQLANASGKGRVPDQDTLNFLLSVVQGIGPRDQTEALLAAQMAVVHCTFMTFARRLEHTETILQQDAAERAFNKLARTFAVQIEALKRYRTGGEQRVTVQHVHVSEGGQAIVGNVAAGGGGPGKLEAAP